MYKKLIALIVTLIVLLPLVGHTEANETNNESEQSCENIEFNIKTPNINDEVIKGTAFPMKDVTIKIDEREYQKESKKDGKFEITLEKPLLENQKIKIEQGKNKFEYTIVKKEEQVKEIVEYEDVFNCEGLVEIIEEEQEESVEDESNTKVDSTESEEDSESTSEAKVVEKEQEELDAEPEKEVEENFSSEPETSEAVEEDSTTDEDAEEQKVLDNNVDEETEESSAETESSEPVEEETLESDATEVEKEQEELNNVPDEKTEEEPSLETENAESIEEESTSDTEDSSEGEADEAEETAEDASSEPENSEVEEEETDIENKEDDKEIKKDAKENSVKKFATNATPQTQWKSCPTKEEYNASINIDAENGPFKKYITGDIVCVTKLSELNWSDTDLVEALDDRNVEVVIMMNDLSGTSANNNIRSTSDNGQVVLDVNGYSLNVNSLTSTSNMGIFEVRDSNVKNFVVKNARNLKTQNTNRYSGMFIAEQVVDMHFVDVNFNVENDQNAGMFGSGYQATLNFHGTNNINSFRTSTNGYAINYPYVKVHSNSTLNLNAGNGGMNFISNSSFPSNLPVGLWTGSNAKVNVKTALRSAFLYEANNPESSGTHRINFDLHVGVNSSVIANSNLVIRDNGEKPTNITVTDGGYLDISSPTYSAIESRVTNVDVASDGTLNLSKGTGAGYDLLTLNGTSHFNIDNPKSVDLKNDSGKLLSTASSDVTFNLGNTSLQHWNNNNGDPAEAQIPISNGQLTYKNGVTNFTINNQSVSKEKYNIDFQNVSRMLFENYIVETPVVDGPIYDKGTKKVTGKSTPDAKVRMTNSSDTEFEEIIVSVNSEGNFEIDLTNIEFNIGDKLHFTTIYNNNRESEPAIVEVEGNILELIQPKDIIFETTEIDNEGERIISKTEPVTLEVKNTANRDFVLTVSADGPLSSDNSILENSLVYRDGSDFTPIENEAVGVKGFDEPSASNDYIQSTVWEKGTGIVLRVNPLEATAANYSTTLNWELSSGPTGE